MVVISTPDADGKIIHTVQPYQALIIIAQAYKVTVDTILTLNGIQAEWPLQIRPEAGYITRLSHPQPDPAAVDPRSKNSPRLAMVNITMSFKAARLSPGLPACTISPWLT